MPRGPRFVLPYHPVNPDDTCNLNGVLYTPDSTVFGPGPYPGLVCTTANTFKGGGNTASDAILTDFMNRGYLCLYGDVRLMHPPSGLPGQTTDGRWPQQQDDLRLHVAYLRSLELCNGFVASLGGSGSGHHSLWQAIAGTPGVDRADAAIALSPVTDLGDRTLPGITDQFVQVCNDYGRSTDPDTLTSRSPVAGITSPVGPIFFSNGTLEHDGLSGMPYSQHLRFKAALDALGITNYTARTNVTQEHSWQTWFEVGPFALDFLDAAYAAWTSGGGSGPPPPPPPTGNITGYSWRLTGGPGGVTGDILGDAVSAPITGLAPNLPYTFYLRAENQYGSSPWVSANFISDRSASGGGGGGTTPLPVGIVDRLPTVDGLLPDIASLDVWPLAYIPCCHYHTQWDVIQPTSETGYNWDDLDRFLTICRQNRKRGAISVSAGNGTPSWVTASRFTDSSGRIFPLPWDLVFRAKLDTFIKALAERYDGNIAVSHIVAGGFGVLSESPLPFMIPVTNPDIIADAAALKVLAQGSGFSTVEAAWFSAARATAATYMTSFLNKFVVIDLDYGIPPSVEFSDKSLQDLSDVVARGGNSGWMDELLTATTDGTNQVDFTVAGKRRNIGYQKALESTSAPDFFATLAAGVALQPTFIEVLDADAIKPTPYPTYLQDTAQQLRDIQQSHRGARP